MASAASSAVKYRKPSELPPLRKEQFTADPLFDTARCDWVKGLWHEQDDLLRQRDRQVEENVRMLLGQQWLVWSDLRQRFVNLADHLTDDEKRWRHMPVLNRLFLWYVLQHARMNENPPVISFQPGPDRIDAMLAEVMDPVYKYLWRDTQMLEVLDRLFSWLIPSGRAYLKSRIDLKKGEPIKAQGSATLRLLGADGNPISSADGSPIEREVGDVPFNEQGEPQAELYEDGMRPTADPFVFNEGGISVDVLTCLEVRGEWGPKPWHEKGWHIHRSFLTPLQAHEEWGIELEPDTRGDSADGVGVLWRLLQGSGLWGAADSHRDQTGSQAEFCTIYEAWMPPSRMPGTQRTQESPGGRLMIVTGGGKVIRDGVRTAPFRYTSPIRAFDYVNLPGRPHGTSPQEMLNGPIRTRNRLHAQQIGHATLVANPIRVVDRSAGIESGDIKNIPGEEILADRSRNPTGKVMEYIAAPPLGSDVMDAADRLRVEFDDIGSVSGTSGAAPTEDSSGELVKELRFNSDRPIASTLRRATIELGRTVEDWKVMIPIIWDQEKILSIVGEDGIARAITVWPELFKEGSVTVEPEIESMLPEGRGERQARVERLYTMGIYGMPGTPEAVNGYLDEARFPHMARALRPGGADRAMAEQNVGKLLQGTPAAEVAVFEWYDHMLHQAVLERFMKSPEYLKLDPALQQEFVFHRENLIEAGIEAMTLQAQRGVLAQAGAMSAQLSAEAGLQEQGTAMGLQPPPEKGPTGELSRTRSAVA